MKFISWTTSFKRNRSSHSRMNKRFENPYLQIQKRLNWDFRFADLLRKPHIELFSPLRRHFFFLRVPAGDLAWNKDKLSYKKLASPPLVTASESSIHVVVAFTATRWFSYACVGTLFHSKLWLVAEIKLRHFLQDWAAKVVSLTKYSRQCKHLTFFCSKIKTCGSSGKICNLIKLLNIKYVLGRMDKTLSTSFLLFAFDLNHLAKTGELTQFSFPTYIFPHFHTDLHPQQPCTHFQRLCKSWLSQSPLYITKSNNSIMS